MTISILGVILVALFPIGPWAMVIIWRALRRNPDIHQLRAQLVRFGLSSGQALVVAVIALNYLLGSPLPRGTGFVLLVIVLLLISGAPASFLIDHYYRRLTS